MTVARNITIPVFITVDNRTPEQKARELAAAYGEDERPSDHR